MSDPADRSARVRILIAQQAQGDGTVGFLQRVCTAAAGSLGASGAGVSVASADGAGGISAASDPASERAGELQFVLGEGPRFDAYTTACPVLIADLGAVAPGRWPMYAPTAHDNGLRAVFAFPLRIGATSLGVLDVYRDRVGPLTAEELAYAVTFTDVLVQELLYDHRAGGTAGMSDAVAHHAELFQAQGRLMVQLGVSIGEALVLLRARAYAEDRPLGDVASDIVAGHLRLDHS
jgi:hypothetical protein